VAPAGRKRITVVTNAILGVVKTGGSGTANTFLSFALARAGHDVEILVTPASGLVELDENWAHRYAERGIRVRLLDPPRGVVPGALGLAVIVQEALESHPPDVAVVDAWSGSGYTALRLRDLGLALRQTTFILVCNGPTAWAYETERKLPRSFPAFELEEIERASAELADAVVSPSRFLLDWLTDRGWRMRRSFVAPYFTQTSVDGAAVQPAEVGAPLRRIAFFGRLEERKGLTPFLAALNGLDEDALSGIELAFVGRTTRFWTVDRVESGLSVRVKNEISGLRFETALDQPEAIALLKQPGTLAVMPSLLDNSPNVVYECLEHGIPFLAGRVGGVPELVATEDRDRALVEPTTAGIRAGLQRMLKDTDALHPVRPGFDDAASSAVWEEAIAAAPAVPEHLGETVRVSAVILQLRGADELNRSRDALAAQTRRLDEVMVATSGDERCAAIASCGSDFVLLLEDGDELDRDCVETLLQAQAASDADVVTCGTRLGDKRCCFLGEPNELGLVGNYYGLVALGRRSVLENAVDIPETGGDNDWLLFATLSLGGAKIVSVPRPIVTTQRAAGNPLTDPIGSGASLAVARAFEQKCPPELRELPRLAASLAARRTASFLSPSLSTRLRWIWENEGPVGVARRLRRSVSTRSGL
jgi:O-antigen biosynthesis protein